MGYPAKSIDDIIRPILKKRKKENNPGTNKKTSPKAKSRTPKYFVYIVTGDAGFAPNPFYGFCTLATCKPKIRKGAKEGDWIIGFYSQAKNVRPKIYRSKLVYAMKVKENITFNQYWNDPRFSKKKSSNKTSKRKCGDNIYHTNLKGDWIQEKNSFHDDKKTQETDTRANAVLISDKFFYFGRKDVSVPKSIKESINKSWRHKKTSIDKLGRNHRFLNEESGKIFIEWLKKRFKEGYHDDPIDFDSTRYKKNSLRCGTKKSHKDNVSRKSCRTLTKRSCNDKELLNAS